MADFATTTQYAMGVRSPSDKLELIEYTPGAPGETEVLVDVSHCGMCHSDLHKLLNEWNESTYPLVPGHEVIGVVKAVGAKVTKIKVGDRVGYGPQRGSCGTCGYCEEKLENCCAGFQGLYDPKYGGYATSITVNEAFTFPIPDAIPSNVAGPLLCAGVTTFAPLQRYVKPGMCVSGGGGARFRAARWTRAARFRGGRGAAAGCRWVHRRAEAAWEQQPVRVRSLKTPLPIRAPRRIRAGRWASWALAAWATWRCSTRPPWAPSRGPSPRRRPRRPRRPSSARRTSSCPRTPPP